MLELPGLIYDEVKRLSALLHVISYNRRIVAICNEFWLIFNNLINETLQRQSCQVLCMVSYSSQLRHAHLLHDHWPVERKAVRKLSMINKKNYGNPNPNRQQLDERSDKKTNSTECNSPFPGN